MTTSPAKNLAASVHQRLLNRARKEGRPFTELLQYFAMERFLFRMAASPHKQKLILKGALMLIPWKVPLARATMDIDVLAKTSNRLDHISSLIRDICLQEVVPDGLIFAPGSVRSVRIKEEADYQGVPASTFLGRLGKTRVPMQLDVGFGDVIVPAPQSLEYPTLLDFPAPRLLGYTMETTIAEKTETMVRLGMINSRMKDFYDIWQTFKIFIYPLREY